MNDLSDMTALNHLVASLVNNQIDNSVCSTAGVSEDSLIRLKNLRALGYSAGQMRDQAGSIYQYWRDLIAGNRSFGEKIARRIEGAFGLPRGCLDDPDGCKAHGPIEQPPRKAASGRSVYAELLADYFDQVVPDNQKTQVPAFTRATEALADFVAHEQPRTARQSPSETLKKPS